MADQRASNTQAFDWFSYDPNGDGFGLHATEEEARAAAQRALDTERDLANDEGWDEGVDGICWGRISAHVVETLRRPRMEEDLSPHAEIVDYALTEVPRD